MHASIRYSGVNHNTHKVKYDREPYSDFRSWYWFTRIMETKQTNGQKRQKNIEKQRMSGTQVEEMDREEEPQLEFLVFQGRRWICVL